MKKRILIKNMLEFIGFMCVILTFFFILTLFVVVTPRVLDVEPTKWDIGFFIIIVGGAMNYIFYHIITPRSNSPSASANAEDLICIKQDAIQEESE
jgi:hypothetical protein